MTPDEISRFRVALPAFDPVSTPSAGMGWIAECVRLMPGTIRSAHPQTSFAALGPQAHALMAGHAPDCHFGENSPLARLYQAGGAILLLGVGYQACSAFHLAEYRYVPDPPHRTYRCVISDNGQARWWEYRDVVLHDRDFAELGAEFDQTGRAVTGRVGGADCRLGVPARSRRLRSRMAPQAPGPGVKPSFPGSALWEQRGRQVVTLCCALRAISRTPANSTPMCWPGRRKCSCPIIRIR